MRDFVSSLCLFGVLLLVQGASLVAARPKAHKAPVQPAAAPVVAAPDPAPEPAATSGEAPKPAEPEPQPAPMAAEPVTKEPTQVDDAAQLASLRGDVSQLIDDMVQARARAALLGKTLFKTRLQLKIQNLTDPKLQLAQIVLKLDGAPVFRGDGSALHEDDARQVFEGFIAPGPHVLLVELEQRSRADAAYGYTLHDSYRFQALREKQSELTLVIDDDSDLAEEFADSARGEYDVRVKLRVRTKKQGEE